MKTRTWLLAALVLSAPALAENDVQVRLRLSGMALEVAPLGVPEASSDKVDLVGVPAVKITNRDNRVASCQFHALPEETVMTAAPSVSIAPNEQSVLRVPGKYSAGGPLALLVCEPVGSGS